MLTPKRSVLYRVLGLSVFLASPCTLLAQNTSSPNLTPSAIEVSVPVSSADHASQVTAAPPPTSPPQKPAPSAPQVFNFIPRYPSYNSTLQGMGFRSLPGQTGGSTPSYGQFGTGASGVQFPAGMQSPGEAGVPIPSGAAA